MHSFHHSRGRILFEILCALTIAAACALAWVQTGASALLAIAGVAALHSLVQVTDLGRRKPAVVTEPAQVEPVAVEQVELPVAPVIHDSPPAVEATKAPKAKRRSRKKPAPSRPTPEAAVEVVVIEPQIVEAVAEAEFAPEAEVEAVAPWDIDGEEADHVPIAPLFEPQPLVRQQRAVFGRKAG